MAEDMDIGMSSEDTKEPGVRVMYQLPGAFCRNPIIRCSGGRDKREARWMDDTDGRAENGRWMDEGDGTDEDKQFIRRESGKLISKRDRKSSERDDWPNTDGANGKGTCERPPIKRIIREWKAEIAQKKMAKKRKMDEAIGQSIVGSGGGGGPGGDSACGGVCSDVSTGVCGEFKRANHQTPDDSNKRNVPALKTPKRPLDSPGDSTHSFPSLQNSTPSTASLTQPTAHSTLASLATAQQSNVSTSHIAKHSTPNTPSLTQPTANSTLMSLATAQQPSVSTSHTAEHSTPNTASLSQPTANSTLMSLATAQQPSVSTSHTAKQGTPGTLSLSQLATAHSNKNTLPSFPSDSEPSNKSGICHSTAPSLSQPTAPNTTFSIPPLHTAKNSIAKPPGGNFNLSHPHTQMQTHTNAQSDKRTDFSLSKIAQTHLHISATTPNTTSVCSTSPSLSSLAALHRNANANPNVQSINIPPLSIPRFSIPNAQMQVNVTVPPFSLSAPPLAIPNTQTQTESNTNALTNTRPNAALPPFPFSIPPLTIPNTQMQTNTDLNAPTNTNALTGVQTNVQTNTIPPSPLSIPPLTIPNTKTQTNAEPNTNAATEDIEEDAFEGLIEGMEWNTDTEIDLKTALVTKKTEPNTASDANTTDAYFTPPPPIIEETHTHTNALTHTLLKRTPSPFGLVIAGWVPGGKPECPVENVIRVPFAIFRFDSPSPDELVEMAKNDPSNPSRYKLITVDRMNKR